MSRQGARPLPPGGFGTDGQHCRKHQHLRLAPVGAITRDCGHWGLLEHSRTPCGAGSKTDFNALRAPTGYVAGMGRGAAGFTTRSDIGPSMPAPDVDKASCMIHNAAGLVDSCRMGEGTAANLLRLPPRVAAATALHIARTSTTGSVLQGKDAGGDETKFDEFLGNDAGVLGATGVYDEEDREADNVWDDIEDRMDERRKVSRPVGWVGGWAGE